MQKISLDEHFSRVQFLPNRSPEMPDEETAGAFSTLSAYRGGGIYIGHYAGNSQWERHAEDEIVMVLEGCTTLFLMENGEETGHTLGTMELVVVPANTWHRFETPKGVKVFSVTPDPTDHVSQLPG